MLFLLAAFEAQRLAEQRQSDMMSQQKEKEAKYAPCFCFEERRCLTCVVM